jgi:hypothetical protein
LKEIEIIGYDYQKESAKNDMSMSRDTVRILSLPIDIEKIEPPFPEIKLAI